MQEKIKDDTISRLEAISALCQYKIIDHSVVRRVLMSLPTAQPERKTGRWTIKNGELAFWDVCSECKKMVMHKAPFYNYCPNCGADMRGGTGLATRTARIAMDSVQRETAGGRSVDICVIPIFTMLPSCGVQHLHKGCD